MEHKLIYKNTLIYVSTWAEFQKCFLQLVANEMERQRSLQILSYSIV
jgi:hypothetical protein